LARALAPAGAAARLARVGQPVLLRRALQRPARVLRARGLVGAADRLRRGAGGPAAGERVPPAPAPPPVAPAGPAVAGRLHLLPVPRARGHALPGHRPLLGGGGAGDGG